MTRNRRNGFPGVLVILCMAGSVGCGSTEPEPDPAPTHPEEPLSNDVLVWDHVASVPRSFIAVAMRRSDSGYYVHGFQDTEFFGAVDADGQSLWTVVPDYNIRGIGVVPAEAASLANAIVAVGAKDTNNDDIEDTAFVTIAVGDGTVIDELEWRVENHSIAFPGVTYVGSGAATNEPVFLVVGHQINALGATLPLVATVTVIDSTLSVDSLQVFSAAEEVVFLDVVPDTPGSNLGFFIAGSRLDTTGNEQNPIVARVSEALELGWLEDLIPIDDLDSWAHDGSLALSENAVFLVGTTEVERTSSSGGHWSAGFVASLSKLGSVNWLETIDPSRWSDGFRGCQVVRGVVYAAGLYGSFVNTPTNRLFGYAWLYQMDADTGTMLAHRTLGSNEHQSGWNSILVGRISSEVFGWTESTASGDEKSWIAQIDVGWSSPAELGTRVASREDVNHGVPRRGELQNGRLGSDCASSIAEHNGESCR